MISSMIHKPFDEKDKLFCVCQITFQLKIPTRYTQKYEGSESGSPVANEGEAIFYKTSLRNSWPLLWVWQMIILPFMLGWARVLSMATDSLFILSLLTPVEFQSISRDLEQELETEDKSSGEKAGVGGVGGVVGVWVRAQGRSQAMRFICAAWRFVATHRETNAYEKLEGSPLWLWSTSIDFVMFFISVQSCCVLSKK